MANRVAGAIRDNAVLVCEAGTGTGKTFAYLVPALLSAGKVILSTGTKTLQDQLYHRDLPTVRTALNVPVTTALLKGRANCVCHYPVERNLAEVAASGREVSRDLQRIMSFARVTRTGDKSELADVPEEAPAWNLATSTRENCLGQSCPRFRDCFVMAARREALAADLVVVNHHLFFADVMLKDEGMAELLPACNTVIFDEADQLPETATLFSIAVIFRRQLDGHPRAWIFTSATLAVAGDFSHYRGEMGLDDARTAFWDSPFDYAAQALLYVPKRLPDPNSDEHTRAVVAASLPVIQASGGSAFLLFTTLRAMRLAHELLREEFRRYALGFPLMLQGEGSRSELLGRFRRLGNAVLLGSASFWEGVDVRGYALSLAVIDNRSEEHTSELQSHSDLVCRLLLEKKKKNTLQQLLVCYSVSDCSDV